MVNGVSKEWKLNSVFEEQLSNTRFTAGQHGRQQVMRADCRFVIAAHRFDCQRGALLFEIRHSPDLTAPRPHRVNKFRIQTSQIRKRPICSTNSAKRLHRCPGARIKYSERKTFEGNAITVTLSRNASRDLRSNPSSVGASFEHPSCLSFERACLFAQVPDFTSGDAALAEEGIDRETRSGNTQDTFWHGGDHI